jgi:hypothetical protein
MLYGGSTSESIHGDRNVGQLCISKVTPGTDETLFIELSDGTEVAPFDSFRPVMAPPLLAGAAPELVAPESHIAPPQPRTTPPPRPE